MQRLKSLGGGREEGGCVRLDGEDNDASLLRGSAGRRALPRVRTFRDWEPQLVFGLDLCSQWKNGAGSLKQ